MDEIWQQIVFQEKYPVSSEKQHEEGRVGL